MLCWIREHPKTGVDISSQQSHFQWLQNPTELKVLSVLRTQRRHGLLLHSGWRRWPQKGTHQQSNPEDRSCGAQVFLHWAPSPLPLPHRGELHKAILPQGCLWAEIISPLNRKEAYKMGVREEGSQNMINWYLPLSNYTTALPGMCKDVHGHTFCLPAGAHSRHSRLSPMDRWAPGKLGLLFKNFFGWFEWG